MGTIQENLQDTDTATETSSGALPPQVRTRHSLPAKGSCWYCDKPLDSVRKFCGKECADAFDEEAAYTADAIVTPPR